MRPVVLALTLGIVLFVTGLWIGQRTADRTSELKLPDPPSGVPTPPRADPEIMMSIASLGDEIRRLRERLDAESTASPTRAPADGSLSELARRTQVLEALVERMNAARSSGVSTPAPALSLRDPKASPGFASRADLFHDVDELIRTRPPEESEDVQAWNAFNTRLQDAMTRWTQFHLNWSLQEVVERYGQPDSVTNDGPGPTLRFAGQEDDGSPATFLFHTKNGLVVQVYCEGKGV